MLNLINPKIALKLVQSELSKQLGKNINEFSLCYNKDEPLFFIIEGITHPWNDSENVKALIGQLLTQKLPKNLDVHSARIYVSETVKVEIEYFDNDELKTINETL